MVRHSREAFHPASVEESPGRFRVRPLFYGLIHPVRVAARCRCIIDAMRLIFGLVACTAVLLFAQSDDEKQSVAVLQRTFDGIAAHDGEMIRSTMLPDARIYAIRDNGVPTSVAVADMASQIAANKSTLLERFTSAPRVLVRGRVAQVWGEYEFLRDGKFSHCGVDAASLFKTAEGWKIATIVYTAETTGCRTDSPGK